MAKGRAQGKTKHVRMVLNIKSAASVSADGLQKRWFEGFNVDRGRARAGSTRGYYNKQVRTRKLSN